MLSAVKRTWAGVDVTGFDPYKDALQARLINLIWNDENLKQEILKNPKAVFERETGIKFPAELEVRVLEEDEDEFYIVIPPLPPTQAQWENFYQQMSVWWTLTYTWWWWIYRTKTENAVPFREGLESLIIVRFMQDESLRHQLFTEPKTALEKQAGIQLPANIKVQPLAETQNLAYFVLPKNPQLEKRVNGGVGEAWMAAHTWFWWLTSLRIRTSALEATNYN
ncbi:MULTISPECIES: NHLP leader peptide family RiPP precursor [unclassified Tolypothrix]|uniref:NHLP leader peptide family RiPP precursor n=1 Tax=unclassified Tolypothrix TaxID=2649714 RepID=UPI0005EAB5D4|nr:MULTISPECIES: NHLP leader peptide family RiPP precursor [unclassified Tolypothrix]BAY94489.1 nitrile hydratase-like protein [Microchaete diplosiphon NIES-3275]EKE97070.1 hypothetical protein FDUTEX481_06047 [Tolypothrix sp. PCC 7601]MBE9086162.1 NHLP leader peptide family RiPP precursor [Tolypothrix sp. LEGE 11397]UYD28198.1 NHLP leader peptide family RiPP precursor [Tolypothrix sp. PCC 7712]UYD35925.1 NHLP leader peptide family RiPP precursor [Tolypothrix sp. PCC 7601]